jgi:hypothetical protein
VVTPFTLAPDETVIYEHRALVRAYDGGPAPRGRYVAQAYSMAAGDVRVDAAGTPVPSAEAEFEVR